MDSRSRNTVESTGAFQSAIQRARLTWNLLFDHRISFLLKAIPVVTLGYIVSPVDLMPLIPFGPLAPLDDIGVFLLGMNVFFAFIPSDILAEHMERLNIPRPVNKQEDDVVEGSGEFVDK